MTANQYRTALERLSLSQVGAARLFQVGERTSRRWASGETPIPVSVAIVLGMLARKKVSLKDIEAVL